jgi:hypothetical protein
MQSTRDFVSSAGFTEFPVSLMQVLQKFGVASLKEAIAGQKPINRRFCGVPDRTFGDLQIAAFGSPGGRWNRGNLRYQINPIGCNLTAITAIQVNTTLVSAFQQWQNASPFFNFTQVPSGGDIAVAFAGPSQDPRFGSTGGVAATGAYPPAGRLFFDCAETWQPNTLLSAALHEIGHVLGLSHSTRRTSVMYPFDMSLNALDPETIAAIRALYNWQPQTSLIDRGSGDGPALAEAGVLGLTFRDMRLYMLWKGIEGDSGLFWSRLEGNTWTPQRKIEGAGSSHGPAVTTVASGGGGAPTLELFLVWKGVPGDQGIYFSQSFNGEIWTQHQKVPGVGTSSQPAVAQFNGRTWLACKGVSGDQGIYVTTFDGTNWAPQMQMRGIGTSVGPSLAVMGDRLYMIWKGIENDSQVYYTSIDNGPGAIWQAQRVVAFPDANTAGVISVPIGSSHGPSIAAIGNTLYAVWKGTREDSGIYFSSLMGDEWQGQVKIEGVGASARPALAAFNGRLFMAWKGIEGDSNLFFTTFG